MYKSVKVKSIAKSNIKKFIESCSKMNYKNYSSGEIKERIISDILYNMELEKEDYYLDPGSYIMEDRQFQYSYTLKNIDEWIEKCKRELRNGNINWSMKEAYQNVMAFDEEFCKEICKYYKV